MRIRPKLCPIAFSFLCVLYPVRPRVGAEHPADIIADLDQALHKAG